MSLAACISRWPSTTRCPWLENSDLPANRSSTECGASFAWRNRAIARVVSQQQYHPAAHAHAPHAHDLARKVGVAKALEQPSAITGQALEVGLQQVAGGKLEPQRSGAVDEIRDRHDQRWVGPDARLTVPPHGKLRERPGTVLSPALRHRPVELLDLAVALACERNSCLNVADARARVPHIQCLHGGELTNRLSVLADQAGGRSPFVASAV